MANKLKMHEIASVIYGSKLQFHVHGWAMACSYMYALMALKSELTLLCWFWTLLCTYIYTGKSSDNS